MPVRPVVAFVLVGALLVLSVGIGSALFVGSGQRGRVQAPRQPTSTVEPGTPQIVSLLAPSPLPTEVGTQVLDTAVVDTMTPEVVPTLAPSATALPPQPPPATATATRVPTRRATPAPERTGGPVLVPNKHKGVRWV